jgi:hypothetical protein
MRIGGSFSGYDSLAKGTPLPIFAVFTDSWRPLTQGGKVGWVRNTP